MNDAENLGARLKECSALPDAQARAYAMNMAVDILDDDRTGQVRQIAELILLASAGDRRSETGVKAMGVSVKRSCITTDMVLASTAMMHTIRAGAGRLRGSRVPVALYYALNGQVPTKVIYRAFERESDNRLIESGVHPGACWLTKKGKARLREIQLWWS